MNVGTFTGNIGKDAETRFTKSGTAIASWSIAVKSGYGDNEKTTWIKCLLWGKRAEGGLIPYLTKGTQIAVSGEISLSEWTNKDNETRTTLELNVNEIDLIGGKPQGQQSPSQAAQAPAPAPHQDDEFSDQIPF